MKKIGVIADPHSNLQALEAVLDDMPRVDKIVCAGDLVGYGGQPNEVVETARSREISSVRGNHDHAVLTREVSSFNSYAAKAALWTNEVLTKDNKKYLENLPEEMEFEENKQKIYVVHGSPRRPLMEYIFPGSSNQELVRLTKGVNAPP
ncbi:MAG: metallophosphoesterase family protein, partial [Hadesarchaea archaeon]|nr:metallophosphoesterase family protein [Hadesarchaea archaeon]